MRPRRSWTLALLGLLLAPALGWATYRHLRLEETWSVVRAAATAHERVSYAGTLSSTRGKPGWTTDVVHDAEHGLSRYTWNRGRAKSRFGWKRPHGWTVCGVGPRSDPAGFCLDLAALEENYDARDAGTGRFLGRRTRLVELEPRHEGRPHVRLQVDVETSLPLEVATFHANGEFAHALWFRELRIGAQRVAEPRHGLEGTPVSAAAARESAGFELLHPEYVPDGFRCVDTRLRKWVGISVTRMYTDGITAFELRQSEVQTPARIETSLRRRMGIQRAERVMKWILRERMRVLAENDVAGDGVAVRREKRGPFRGYTLRVDEVEVSLTSRTDFDAEETLRVLRSLTR